MRETNNLDHKYENYLSTLIGLKIKNNADDTLSFLDELYEINPNSKSYQYNYQLLINRGLIKSELDEEQSDLKKQLKKNIEMPYDFSQVTMKLVELLNNPEFDSIKKSYYSCQGKNNIYTSKPKKDLEFDFKFSDRNRYVSILIYQLNYMIIKEKKYPNSFANLLCEILKINNMEYYNYYYLIPNSVGIQRSDIFLAIQKSNINRAFFYMENLFSKNLLTDELKDIWFVYLNYFNSIKSTSGLLHQIMHFDLLTDDIKKLVIDSILFINNEQKIIVNSLQIDKIKNKNFENLDGTFFNHIKVDADYEREVQQLKPINGYKYNLKVLFRDDFNYIGAYKYIEMINQILMGSNLEVLELKNEYQIYHDKLELIIKQKQHYIPRDDSFYRKGIISSLIEEDVEKAEHLFVNSIKNDEKYKNFSLMYLVDIYKNIDFQKALSYYEKYHDVLKNEYQTEPTRLRTELDILDIEKNNKNYMNILSIISTILNRLEANSNKIKKYLRDDSVSKLYLTLSKTYTNKEKKAYGKALEALEKSKEYGLNDIIYNYQKALCLIGMNQLKDARKYLQINIDTYEDENSISLLNSEIFTDKKTKKLNSSVQDLIVNQSESILNNELIKQFLDSFIEMYVDIHTKKALSGLKSSQIEKLQFTKNDFDKMKYNFENAKIFEDQWVYSLGCYIISSKLNIKSDKLFEYKSNILYKLFKYQ